MRYLLDTHTFLWFLFEPDKLSKKVSKLILDNENIIFVSLISFWEISLKFNIGKISLNKVTPEELPRYATNSGIEILNLEIVTVSSFHNLPIESHRDPFDRLIIWQCIKSDLTLLSKDTMTDEYKKYNLKSIW